MAYVKNTWVDQDVERPKTYEVTNNQDGSITLTDSFGLVTELGTPVNAVNMNHIEDGLADTDVTKYNATTTYNAGEWVTGVVDNKKGIYASKVNNNTGNALTNDTYWEKVELGGGARNIGEIVTSTIPLTDAGLHLLDGALLQYGSYQAFIDYIADLYDSGDYAAIFETEANWQTAVTTYGVCGKFVYDSVNNTVRLPKITGIVEGTTDLNALGDLVDAGLPNITGTFVGDCIANTVRSTSGALYGYSSGYPAYGQTGSCACLGFDASLSNSIYGNSTTVQPQTIKVFYYIVIATSTKTDIQVDIDEIATDLNGKADVDLTNINNTGKIAIAHNAMPSNTYEDLTLGASGTTYTAPANGYFVILADLNTSPCYLAIYNTSSGIGDYNGYAYVSDYARCYVPVKKGDIIQVDYTSISNMRHFRFYYAVGSESEAS